MDPFGRIDPRAWIFSPFRLIDDGVCGDWGRRFSAVSVIRHFHLVSILSATPA